MSSQKETPIKVLPAKDIKPEKEELTNNAEDVLQLFETLDSVLRHIKHVRDNCVYLGKKLIARGEVDFGLKLIQRGLVHDNSKLGGMEFRWLNQTADKEKLKIAIQYHEYGNDHHVEAWGGINFMPRIAIAELVCDLKARSEEFGTDLKEYIMGDFSEKNDIPPHGRVAKIIKDFLDLILEPPFKKLG